MPRRLRWAEGIFSLGTSLAAKLLLGGLMTLLGSALLGHLLLWVYFWSVGFSPLGSAAALDDLRPQVAVLTLMLLMFISSWVWLPRLALQGGWSAEDARAWRRGIGPAAPGTPRTKPQMLRLWGFALALVVLPWGVMGFAVASAPAWAYAVGFGAALLLLGRVGRGWWWPRHESQQGEEGDKARFSRAAWWRCLAALVCAALSAILLGLLWYGVERGPRVFWLGCAVLAFVQVVVVALSLADAEDSAPRLARVVLGWVLSFGLALAVCFPTGFFHLALQRAMALAGVRSEAVDVVLDASACHDMKLLGIAVQAETPKACLLPRVTVLGRVGGEMRVACDRPGAQLGDRVGPLPGFRLPASAWRGERSPASRDDAGSLSASVCGAMAPASAAAP
jgi:hypothetical protein